MKLMRLLGLASPDPLRRLRTLEMIAEHQLRRLPQEQIDRHLEIPPPLPQETLNGARLFQDRETMLEVIPKGGEVAEVGTFRGYLSAHIASVVRPRFFHLIDLDFSPFEASLDCQFEQHQGDSSTVLNTFAPASLDWIYIDGDHSYEGARKDLEAAHRALRPGCLMTVNDWTNWATLSVGPYGVARATNEFIIAHDYNEFIIAHDYKVEGLAFFPAGNHDLLIRKPVA